MSNKKKLATFIKENQLIILPTDTVYGLLCRYNSEEGVQKIYDIKKREREKPLILLGYSWRVLKKFVDIKKVDDKVLEEYRKRWPGATTLVLPASSRVPSYINQGFKTVGIRIPNNKYLLSFLKECPGGVLASTSANLSGKSDKKPQKEVINKVSFFKEAKIKEMSFAPSEVIGIEKKKVTIYR